MKHKGDCQECGRLVYVGKLRKSAKDNRMLCTKCYSKENTERNKCKEIILPEVNNSVLKQKSLLCEPKNDSSSYLMKGEDSVLTKKYKFDDFKRGTKDCSELARLRTGLAATRNKRRSEGKYLANQINDIKIKQCSYEENKEFLESFKSLR